MLSPKKVKHRKLQRHYKKLLRGSSTRGNLLAFGEYGIISLSAGLITARQIEAARIAMTRHVKRGGKVWIRIFPDIPYTKKPAETRMGSGKGSPERWVAAVKTERVLFELAGVADELAQGALKRAISKLPIKAKIVKRDS